MQHMNLGAAVKNKQSSIRATIWEGIYLLEEYDNYPALIYLKIHLTWGIHCYTKITTARIP